MRWQWLEAKRAKARREPLALLEHQRNIGRRGKRRDRERGRQRRDRRRSLPRVQLGGRIRGSKRVTEASACQTESL